jgi:single-strand DNA-binding protein
MSAFNKVILMGNLTRDPDLRVTPKGISVCQFSLAINSTYRDREGNPKEEVTFVDVDSFGKQADVIAKHMAKGRPLLVEGRLKQDTWEDKDGGKRSKLKVVLEGFQFVGSPVRSDDEITGVRQDARERPAFPGKRSARASRAKGPETGELVGVGAKDPF